VAASWLGSELLRRLGPWWRLGDRRRRRAADAQGRHRDGRRPSPIRHTRSTPCQPPDGDPVRARLAGYAAALRTQGAIRSKVVERPWS